MHIIITLVVIFLGLALGIFGFTGKAIVMWFLSVNLFYIGWMIIHFWKESKVRKAWREASNVMKKLGDKDEE